MKFIGRDVELRQLEKFETLSRSGAAMVGILGRRRVGKTTLVKEFMKRSKRNSVYLFVDEKREELLLAEFTEIIKTAFNTTLPVFRDWDTFFSYLMGLENVNIIFDEFQNFAVVNSSVFSIFQKHYDAHPDAHILFLLVGSYMGMMKRIFGEERSPLFGRTASIWKIRPFTLKDLTPTLPDKPEGAIPIYLLYGGIPRYYELMERFNCTNIKDSLRELLYWDGAPLLYEPQMLLSQEFRGKWRTMFSILEAISTGRCSHKEISDYTGIPQTNLSKYLEELADDYEIISKEFPVTEDHKRTKMGRYRIREHFLSFWFRFIYKNRTMVERGDWKTISSTVERDINSHLGKKFEKLAREIVSEAHPDMRVGSWWSRQGEEIDIIAYGKNKVIYCEVKYTNRKVGENTLEELKRKSHLVPLSGRKEYLLISKSGFTRGLTERKNLKLWTLQDIWKKIHS